jgi:hypothetical protein
MNNLLYQELASSQQEGRQPICPHCQKPLAIEEMQYKIRVWRWDEQTRCYQKTIGEEGTSRPCCSKCQAEFPIFIGSEKLLRDLGIDY